MRRRGARRTARRTTRRRMRRGRRMRRRMRRRMIIGGMVLLAVGYGAYKLTKKQVKQVEQHTGKKAEDLSEEELEGAMDELGIQAQEPTDKEIAMLEAGDEPDKKPATQAASPDKPDESYLDELERLASFRDQGIITQEEFDAKKKDLLGL
ncbi:SHOCT domain-containing protein [Chloroflexota bacterium]